MQRTFVRLGALVGAGIVYAACAGDVSMSPAPSATGGGSAVSTATGSTGGSPAGGDATGSTTGGDATGSATGGAATGGGIGGDATGGSTGSGATTATTGTAGDGSPCAPPCGGDEFCHTYSSGECDSECQERPTTCGVGGIPVCGKDGSVYANTCEAHKAGHDLGEGCAAPAGTFVCGSYFCDPQVYFCRKEPSDCVPSLPPVCVEFPSECGALPPADCACLEGPEKCYGVNDATCAYVWDHFEVYCSW